MGITEMIVEKINELKESDSVVVNFEGYFLQGVVDTSLLFGLALTILGTGISIANKINK